MLVQSLVSLETRANGVMNVPQALRRTGFGELFKRGESSLIGLVRFIAK